MLISGISTSMWEELQTAISMGQWGEELQWNCGRINVGGATDCLQVNVEGPTDCRQVNVGTTRCGLWIGQHWTNYGIVDHHIMGM
jgi:hypothetical protein